jgi:hypothetical protein
VGIVAGMKAVGTHIEDVARSVPDLPRTGFATILKHMIVNTPRERPCTRAGACHDLEVPAQCRGDCKDEATFSGSPRPCHADCRILHSVIIIEGSHTPRQVLDSLRAPC